MSDTIKIEPVGDLLSYFHEELTSAFQRINIKTSTETEAYLVHLLDAYARPDVLGDEVGFGKPAAALLEEAMLCEGERRIEAYRRLGDVSLYSCGFFAEHLTRRNLSASYYRQVGQTAYTSLTDLMSFKQPGGIFAMIFRELAYNFDRITDAFRWIGRAHAADDIGELVDSLGTSTDTATLLRSGILASKAGKA